MVWCCSKKMGEAEVYDPESGLHSSLGLCIDHDFNFILEASYEQEVVPEKFKGRPLPEVLKYCEQRAQKRGAAGFFFQTHHNSHQIVGFYESVEAMQGAVFATATPGASLPCPRRRRSSSLWTRRPTS